MPYRYYVDRPSGVNFLYYESVNTPDFKRLRTSGGLLPVHDHVNWLRNTNCQPSDTYNGVRNEQDAKPFDVYSSARSGQLAQHGTIERKTIGRPMSQMEADVNNALLEKCRGTKIDLGVALGETRETADMIGNYSDRIGRSALDVTSSTLASSRSDKDFYLTRAFRTLTGGKIDKIREVADLASSAWLGWSYGVRPLLSDIEKAIATVKGADKQPYYELTTVRSRQSDTLNASYAATVQGDYGWKQWTESHNSTRTVSGAMTFYCDNPILRSADQLGLTNPLNVAWELVTLSFVVDWFIPVGDYLANIVPPLGVTFSHGYVTSKISGSASQSTFIPASPFDPRPWDTSGSVTETWKSRKALSGFPSYRPYVPDLSLSLSQATSGIALLWSRLGSDIVRKSERSYR